MICTTRNNFETILYIKQSLISFCPLVGLQFVDSDTEYLYPYHFQLSSMIGCKSILPKCTIEHSDYLSQLEPLAECQALLLSWHMWQRSM